MMRYKGLTLIELILGMAVASIIFVVAGSVYVFVVKQSVRASQGGLLSQTTNDLIQEFTNQVRWHPGNIQNSNQSLTLVDPDGPNSVVYSFASGQIKKDTTPITPQALTITNFEVTKINPASPIRTYQITIALKDPHTNQQDVVTFSVSQRVTSFTQQQP